MGQTVNILGLCKVAATMQLWNYNTKTAIDKICKLVSVVVFQ